MNRLPPLDARIPAWDAGDLVERACPLCGRGDGAAAFVRPDGLTVRRCGDCGTWFVSPAPSERQLAAFYARYDAEHRRDTAATPAAARRAWLRSHPLEDFRIRELASMRPLAGARVLDVGFGRPRVLYDFMRLGAEPHGVELDPGAIEFACALGITRTVQGTIFDLPADDRFDIILLNDLVEHPLAPLPLLEEAARRLAPGGLLAIWTPNGQAIEGETSPVTLRVDLEHMQYFTPAGGARMAARLGLVVVHLETVGFPDLEGIDRPRGLGASPAARLKAALREVPGFEHLNRLRHALDPASATRDERAGTYGLFLVLRRPSGAD